MIVNVLSLFVWGKCRVHGRLTDRLMRLQHPEAQVVLLDRASSAAAEFGWPPEWHDDLGYLDVWVATGGTATAAFSHWADVRDPEMAVMIDDELAAYIAQWKTNLAQDREQAKNRTEPLNPGEKGPGFSTWWAGKILDRVYSNPPDADTTRSRTARRRSPASRRPRSSAMRGRDDWPSELTTQILTRFFMGGIAEHEYLDQPISIAHDAFDATFDVVIILDADAQPAPLGRHRTALRANRRRHPRSQAVATTERRKLRTSAALRSRRRSSICRTTVAVSFSRARMHRGRPDANVANP